MATTEATFAPAATAAVPPPAGRPGPAPSTASLWVGNLAPDVTEANLFELFSAVSQVQNVRVCRSSITKESLGYAYVNFQTAADAEKGLEAMNHQLIKGRNCRIMWSQRDPSLRRSNVGNIFVKNLAPEITSRELHEAFKTFGSILSCKVATNEKGDSKGYGYVHFDGEVASKNALEHVNGMEFAGRKLEVKPYLPKTMRTTGGDSWNNLYVKNLPKAWALKELKELFAPFGEISSSVVSTDETGASRGFGFVCFASHDAAVKAVESLHEREVSTLPGAPAEEAKLGEDGKPLPPLKLYVCRAQKKAERERLLREKQEAIRRDKAQKYQGCNLYVRNLDESIDDEALRREFAAYGTIVSAKVSRDPNGASKGFGFVCMSLPEEANKAREAEHRKLLQGKPLYVNLFESKEARSQRMAQSQRGFAARGAAAPGMAGFGMAPGVAGLNPMMQQQQFTQAMANPQFAAMLRSMAPGNEAFMAAMLMQMQALMRSMGGLQQGQAPMARGSAGNGRAGMPGGMPFNPFFPMANPAMMQAMQGGMGMNMAGQRANRSRGGQQTGAPAPGAVRVAGGPGAARTAQPPILPGTGAASPRQAGQQQAAAAAAAARPARAGGAVMPGAAAVPGGNVPFRPVDATAAAAPVPVAQSFAAQVAAATPDGRRNMIGEALFLSISRSNPQVQNLAGKITGMLLDGIETSELLHLLESPVELQSRINEAVEVLEQHQQPTA